MPGFVRILVFVEIISEENTALEAIPGTTFAFVGLDSTLWADGEDGYFYYLELLEGGQTTVQPLFTGVKLASGLPATYDNARMRIEIKVEASEPLREKYRDGWWKNGDVAPGTPTLQSIDSILEAQCL
jgi:hypothetical protein